jgi:hypothetical protein
MTLYCQAGRAIFDLDKSVYRRRELTREPLAIGTLRFASPQEEKAERFITARLVKISNIERQANGRTLSGTVLDNARNEEPVLRLDADDRLVEARCTCGFYVHNKMMRGPCEHMLAVRRIFHAQVEGIAQGSGGAA